MADDLLHWEIRNDPTPPSKVNWELGPRVLEEINEDLLPEKHWTEEHPLNVERVRCLCGRFAKAGGSRHYYNGWFDCYSYDVICTHCGTVTIECV